MVGLKFIYVFILYSDQKEKEISIYPNWKVVDSKESSGTQKHPTNGEQENLTSTSEVKQYVIMLGLILS